MISALVTFFIIVLIVGFAYWAFVKLIAAFEIQLPPIIPTVIQILVVLVILVAVINLIISLIGGSPLLHVR